MPDYEGLKNQTKGAHPFRLICLRGATRRLKVWEWQEQALCPQQHSTWGQEASCEHPQCINPIKQSGPFPKEISISPLGKEASQVQPVHFFRSSCPFRAEEFWGVSIFLTSLVILLYSS